MDLEYVNECFRCEVKGPLMVSCQSCVRKYHVECAGPSYTGYYPWNCLACRQPTLVYDTKGKPECWHCLQPDRGLVKCSTCCRSFHKQCAIDWRRGKPWSCPLCQPCKPLAGLEQITWSSHTPETVSLHKCLSYAIDTVFCNVQESHLLYPFRQELFTEPYTEGQECMDIQIISQKVFNLKYDTLEQFHADWKKMQEYIRLLPEASDMVKTVDEMICTIHCQVAAIRKCQECYIARQELPAHWFQEPCSRPHLLVWAKVRGFRFWPGKVMEVLPNGRVDVHFFGTHNTATIRASECLVYSPQDPTGRPCRTKKWRKAIVEVNQHLAKLAAQFGDVNISSSKQLSTATIKEHLETMLPGASQRKLSETQGEMSIVAVPTSPTTPRPRGHPRRKVPPPTTRRPRGRPKRKVPTPATSVERDTSASSTSGQEEMSSLVVPTPPTTPRARGHPKRKVPTPATSVERDTSTPSTSEQEEMSSLFVPTPPTTPRARVHPKRKAPTPATSVERDTSTPSTSEQEEMSSLFVSTPPTTPRARVHPKRKVPTPATSVERDTSTPSTSEQEEMSSLFVSTPPTTPRARVHPKRKVPPPTTRRPRGRPKRKMPTPATSVERDTPTPSTSFKRARMMFPGASQREMNEKPGEVSSVVEPTPPTTPRPRGRPKRKAPSPATSVERDTPTPSTSGQEEMSSLFVPAPPTTPRPRGRPKLKVQPPTSRRPRGRPKRELDKTSPGKPAKVPRKGTRQGLRPKKEPERERIVLKIPMSRFTPYYQNFIRQFSFLSNFQLAPVLTELRESSPETSD